MCENSETYPDDGEIFNLNDMKESLAIAERLAQAAMMTSKGAKNRLKARRLEMGLDLTEDDFIPPKQVLLYLVRMGSFTSAPKIENTDSADDDICDSFKPTTREDLLKRCQSEIESSGRPALLERNIRNLEEGLGDGVVIRVLQWNVLSQSLGISNDNFVESPPETLDWPYRRYLMLQEILECDPDVICLEEVDHFKFLETALGSIGYKGKFFPKPDSPCVYLEENNGPDGSALFYRTSKFDLLSCQTRILEVWKVQSNQVGLCCILKEKSTGAEICVAATHLKAKSGALLATLRDHQGKDLLDWLNTTAGGRPTILCGDFNAEPTEPVYKTTTNHRLNLRSAYFENGKEPEYTTWKIRQEGEICHTIDYIFHSSRFTPIALLDFPDEKTIGPSRVPSLQYPSDHFSLMADLLLSDV